MAAKNCGNPVTATVLPRCVQPIFRDSGFSIRAWISALFSLLLLSCTTMEKLDLARLSLPPGFRIAVFGDVPHARQMAFSPGGVLLVTNMSDGTVLALPDPKHSGKAERSVPVLSGLNAPHGIAFHNGKLYVAEINAVRRYDWYEAELRTGNGLKIVDLPGSGGGHSTRTILFAHGKMYVAVGSSCNENFPIATRMRK